MFVARSVLRHVLRQAVQQPPRRSLPVVDSALCHNTAGSIIVFNRHYASRTSADNHLVAVLKNEIEHELREEAKKQGSLKGSAGPFELLDKPGVEEITLSRTFGNEQIAVTCLMEPVEEEELEESEVERGEDNEDKEDNEDEEDEKPAVQLNMNVVITKGPEKPALELECSFLSGANDITIESVRYLKDGSSDSVDTPEPYEGPVFSDLDENLQRAFHDLIKARGLSTRVATHVLDYLAIKEQREYMRWLHNLETFFSS